MVSQTTMENIDSALPLVEEQTQAIESLRFKYYGVVVITLAAMFLLYKYMLQIFPSVMTLPLMEKYHLNGAELGNLVAFFFYAYFVMQIFVGVLLDKFSARVLTAVAIIVGALGALLFASANDFFFAATARVLMGVGAAFATVSYMKMAAVWFKPKHFPLVGGLLTVGVMLGALLAEAPLSYLSGEIGWSHSVRWIGYFGLIIGVLFLLLVRERPQAHDRVVSNVKPKEHVKLKHILDMLMDKRNWLLALYSGLAFAPLAVFGGLWGTPFIHISYGISLTESAFCVSMVYVGFGLGGPIFGYLASKTRRAYLWMQVGLVLSCTMLLMIVYVPGWSEALLIILMVLFGFGTSAFMLGFWVGKELNNVILAGSIVALINTGDAVFGGITDPAIGGLLDTFNNHHSWNGIPIFFAVDYQLAFFILPIYLIVASFVLIYLGCLNSHS